MPCIAVPVRVGVSPTIPAFVAQHGTSESALAIAFEHLTVSGNVDEADEIFSDNYHQVSALIDTGAACSVISPILAEKLMLISTGQKTIKGVHNSSRDCHTYDIEIIVMKRHHAMKLEVVAVECDYAIILGMDFLLTGTLSLDWNGRMILCL